MESQSSSAGGGDAGFTTGLSFYTNAGGASDTDPVERLRIDSSGRVGINTSSIDNMVNIQESVLAGRGASNGNTSLTLEHATDTGIQFFSATQTQLRFGDAASTGAGSIIYEHGDDSLRVSTNGSEAMRIDSSGNVGIGTSSPTALIDISKSGTADYSTLRLSNTGASGRKYEIGLGGNAAASDYANKLYFRDSTAGANRMTIDSSGNVGIGITPESWVTGYGGRVLQIGDAAVFGGSTNDSMSYMLANAYYDSVNSRWEYINTDFATRYEQLDGEHIFYTAASGTADAAITWSEAMRLDASGHLLVGTATKETQGVTLYGNGANGVYLKCTATVNYWITNAGQGAGNGTIATIYSDTSVVGSITVTSSSTLYNTSSDYRLKTDAQPMTGATDRDWETVAIVPFPAPCPALVIQ